MGTSESKEMFNAVSNTSSKTKKKFLQSVANHSDAIALIDSTGNYVGFNKAYYLLFEFENEDIASVTLRNLLTFSDNEQPDKQEVTLEALKFKTGQALSKGEWNFIWRYQTLLRKVVEVFVWIHPVRLKDSLFFQVTLRPKDSEFSVKKVDDSMTTSDISAREIGDFCLEEAVRITNSDLGYLAFVNKEQNQLTMFGWSQTAMQTCKAIKKPLVYKLEETGLWGEAIRQRKPVITNDYSKPNPYKRGTPDGHVTVKRHMNLPIFDDVDKKRIVLVVGVGNKVEEYGPEDVKKLEDLMGKMWKIFKKKYKL
ncbi:hypothetical protein M0811_09009 [Anaeramoeba ignava]|uniref:GAF domain-containing protein n=1 Tax=Anaeramoeba ignava TaxID=1746090 RepID=A0A9Q0LIJ1_ANAIG|nr:hypothetical protein M0811_09009 [Anaeramoeba ignava]